MKAILTAAFLASVTSVLAQTVSFRNTDLYTTPADRRVYDFGQLQLSDPKSWRSSSMELRPAVSRRIPTRQLSEMCQRVTLLRARGLVEYGR
jgi:hypothetical protein